MRAIGADTGAQVPIEDNAAAAEDAESASSGGEAPELEDAVEADYDYSEEGFGELASSRFAWLPATLAIVAIVGWTVFYLWAMQGALLNAGSAPMSEWPRLIIDWSVPVVLIALIWLISMRNSRAETTRFASAAALLSNESQELEARLTVVNRELSLAREFLASQSRELESLGRVASERISNHAGELQGLIQTNGEQVDAIGRASETALSNMNRLRDDLPVLANSARDVSNQIGNAGRTATDNLEGLVSGFDRLNQFGEASEAQLGTFAERVSGILGEFENQIERIEQSLGERFDALSSQTEEYRGSVSQGEIEATAALKERIALLKSEADEVSTALSGAQEDAATQLSGSIERVKAEMTQMIEHVDRLDRTAIAGAKKRITELNAEAGRFNDTLAQRQAQFVEEIERRQAQFETREAQASEVLTQRLAELDEMIAERRETQIAETEKLVEHGRAMSSELENFNALIGQIGESSQSAQNSLSDGLGALEEQLASKRAALSETEGQLAQVTEAGVRLLEIIQAGANHSREDLPQAIGTANAELTAVEERAAALNSVMFQTAEQGNELSQYLVKTNAEIEQTSSTLDTLQARLAEQAEEALAKVQGLSARLTQMGEQGENFAGATQDQLREAIAKLEAAANQSFEALETGSRERVTALAETISADAVKALERSLRNESAETIGALEQAASHASGVGREATIQLRDQLAKVNELTGNLEQRIARARELSEEQINNDFSRRMALITDGLNSASIDIAAALSMEVSDTAWDAYLKGDRGIFTRRAVRLIDNSDARDISELYQQDDAFQANVNRYIHDFEAMLRSMLSTREGNALSVTILGSDMGKLYVLLAQSIERLRN
ncbi:MAG: ATPase [Pseudomonadota bacterium]